MRDAFDKCFEVPVLKLRQYFLLLCALPFFIKLFTTMELDSVHQVEDGNFFFIIQAVYNLSAMSWCTYLTVNNYIKVLQ